MSYRISRAMGYGMPWTRFEELCKLTPDAGYGIREALYGCFRSLTDERMTIPEDVWRGSFSSRGLPILERRLLSKVFTSFGRYEVEIGDPSYLYFLVSTPNRIDHILFLPSLYYAERWHRFDDELDYALETWCRNPSSIIAGARSARADPRDFAVYTDYGHCPWHNDLMLADGTPFRWDHHTIVEQHPEWLPAIPSEIRWYLTTLGVLDDAGINELRPLIAQWWG